ncbi:MAG: efflux RND transporter periplasmic adaptor subunit [Colwellia sp.]
MNLIYRLLSGTLLSLFFSHSVFSTENTNNESHESLLLTGIVKAKNSQPFYAPKTDSWQVQIKWMIEEGEKVKAGDLAVVFDSGSIESVIEQEEIKLLAAEEELHRLSIVGEQSILEATFALKRTELLLERAKIDANIPKINLSEYDYQKYQVELEKAIVANIKAKDKSIQTTLSSFVAINKQKLTIEKSQDSLTYNKHKLSKMALYAKRTGPILYASHPWNGEKIFVGSTVQASWKVAEIPALSDLFIESWLHEIDYNKVKLKQQALLYFDAYPQQKFTAILSQLSTQPEERKVWGTDVYFKATFTFKVLNQLKLLPGMSAQLELHSPEESKFTGEQSE